MEHLSEDFSKIATGTLAAMVAPRAGTGPAPCANPHDHSKAKPHLGGAGMNFHRKSGRKRMFERGQDESTPIS